MTTAAGGAVFTTTRILARGVYTDFAPPNILLGTLGVPVGTLVKQVDSQIDGRRTRPLASDFQPSNLLTSAFVVLKAPFTPAPTSDNAQHLLKRWSATDFNPPALVINSLMPPPVHSIDLMGDMGTRKSSWRGVFSDFVAPNVLLIFPPPLIGPYVPVEVGAEIIRKSVYKDFHPANVLLNTLGLIGAGQSFPGRTIDGLSTRRWSATDFATPNFQASTAALLQKAPFAAQNFETPFRARWAATDSNAPNLLTGPFSIFAGNPPKTLPDPSGYPIRKAGIYNDSPQANFLTGPNRLVVTTPLSAHDDCATVIRPRMLASDFNPPNVIAGLLIPIAPPQPPTPVVVAAPGQQLLPYTFPDEATAYRRISEVVNQLVQGRTTAAGGGAAYNPTFSSGQVQYAGPSGQLAGSDNLIFGLNIPNPAGTPGAALLIGSGGGGGSNVVFWVITDQAFDLISPGNDIFHTAGETQPGSSARGGNWTVIAGASDAGSGGQAVIQGGTSVTGRAGPAIIQGGNNTGGNQPAGDVFVIGGQEGSQGGNVHLIATIVKGIAGVIRHRGNSTIRWDEFVGDGSWFFYDGSAFGAAGAPVVSHGPGQPVGFATDGATGTFTSQDGKTITVTQGRITGIH